MTNTQPKETTQTPKTPWHKTHHIIQRLQWTGAVAAIGATTGLIGVFASNALNNDREYSSVDARIRTLAEEGQLTDKDSGTPKPFTVHLDNGAEFSITTKSALISQNGQWLDASGIAAQGVQAQNADGTVRAVTAYTQGYELKGAISRIKGSDNPLRWIFNYGGETDYSKTWSAKPPLAPLSRAQAPHMVITVPGAASATAPSK